MKELSIEEKAKAYEEAIRKAKDMLNYKEVRCEDMEYLFPELKESEDERIKKEITELVMQPTWKTEREFHRRKELCTWLEAQGEHANFRNKIQVGDEVTRNEDGVLVNLSQLNRVAKKDEKQGEQKPTEDEDREYAYQSPEHCTRRELMIYNLGIYNGKKMVEDAIKETKQKPAWSEEDELHIRELEVLVKQVWAIAKHENDKDTIHKMSDLSFFLKELKSQPKQEWSKEDEHMLSRCIRVIACCKNGNYPKIDDTELNWLKSLRPQNRWKPSDEQMNALEESIMFLGTSWVSTRQFALESLYNDLKKLREG